MKTFAMFELKEALSVLEILDRETCFDNKIAAYLLNPLKSDYDEKDVAREYLDLLLDEGMDQERASFYEAYIARESVGVLREKLKEEQMEDLFEKIEMPLVFTLYEMEKNGVKIASDELHAYGQMLGEKEKELEESIYEMAGEVFNINSPKQLGVILFEKMELPE